MDFADEIKNFYIKHVPGASIEKNYLKAPCPFCAAGENEKQGTLVAIVNPESFFVGFFRCLNRCKAGGFPLYFGRLMGIDSKEIPGFDPDREPYVQDIVYPIINLKNDIAKFTSLMTDTQYSYFKEYGVSKAVVDEMKIGYNGRYLVYPYFLEDGNAYAARCILPGRDNDNFWYGNETFFSSKFQIYDMPEIDRCEGGALFITEGENNLLTLKELGYPAIAMPAAADLENINSESLAFINHIFIVVGNAPEAHLSARALATKLGFKARILKWPAHLKRGYNLCQLASEKGKEFRSSVSHMIQTSKSFSPFVSPEKEHRSVVENLDKNRGKDLMGISSGFEKMDQALSGIRGINIMGGPPKAGKSCFYMQVSTEMARRKTPVIYYDFENGRQKIYLRTLCRLSRLSEKEMRKNNLDDQVARRFKQAQIEFKNILHYFRVVTDRKLNPDIMKRQIDFLQHETRRDNTVVVVDSLHKLPFKDLSDRRTGIDSWLRHMEAIRDEQNVAFFVISELSRGTGGQYTKKPDLGSFKESGDIEYSADNAMILIPNWDPIDPISTAARESTLWLAASRENNPGKVGVYRLEYPYWSFSEV
jgi:replicative DNA helicase